MIKNTIILLMGIAGAGKKTIGESIAQQDKTFKLAHHHAWIDPVLRLLGNDSAVWNTLDNKAWDAINRSLDLMLYTISSVCSIESNFIITYEMLVSNPWHHNLFDRIVLAAEKRHALLVPVRLICAVDELIQRVQSLDRKKYYKTQDAALIQQRFLEDEVFYSHTPYEFTLDVTQLSPEAAATTIIDQIKKIHQIIES